MSSSGIISSNNGKIFNDLLPNPYPYPAVPPSLAQVLIAGDDAGNGNIENLLQLQATNIVQQAQIGGHLTIGGTPSQAGSGGDLRIQGATDKGSILAGNGTSTVGLPVGANGLILKANSATATGLEWGTDASGGTVMAVNAGVNIDITGTIAQPIVNLQNPLSAQLNIGSQQIFSSVNVGGTDTTSLNINTSTSATGLFEMDFNDTNPTKPLSGFINMLTDNTQARTTASWSADDTVANQQTQVVKIDTTRENENTLDISISDTNPITVSSIQRNYITRGDDTGCEDTITSIDTTNLRTVIRKEETDFAFGVVDTSTVANLNAPIANASRTSTTSASTVSDAFNYGDGIASVGFSSAVSAGSSSLNQSFGSAGNVGGSQIIATNSLAQHQLRRTTATQQAYIQNNAQSNLSRLQGQLIDTGVGNYSTIDTTNSNCEIRQQVSVSGTTKNASLLTTTSLTTLSSDAPLTVSTTGGNLNVNASNIAGMAGASVSITASGAGGVQLSAPAGNITSTSGSGQQVVVSTVNNVSNPTLTITNSNALTTSYPVIRTDRPTPASLVGDVLGAISTWADDASGVSREWSRIQTKTENVSAGNQDATLSIFNSVNGVVSETFNFNGGQNENNSFRPLDMNGNGIRTTSGDMTISTTASSGTGNLSCSAKGFAQYGAETGYTNIYNTNGDIQFNASAVGDWVMTCPNWESATAGGNSGKHLRIKLNGTYYKIQLLDD